MAIIKVMKIFKEKLNSFLKELSSKKPFFENIEILETFEKEVNGYTLTFQNLKYKDFNGTFQTKPIEIY